MKPDYRNPGDPTKPLPAAGPSSPTWERLVPARRPDGPGRQSDCHHLHQHHHHHHPHPPGWIDNL